MALRAERVVTGFSVLCLTMGLALFYHQTRVFIPQYNQVYDIKDFSQKVLRRVRPEDPLFAFRFRQLSYNFYLRRPVREIQDPKELGDLVSGGRSVYFLVEERGWGSFKRRPERAGRSWSEPASADGSWCLPPTLWHPPAFDRSLPLVISPNRKPASSGAQAPTS